MKQKTYSLNIHWDKRYPKAGTIDLCPIQRKEPVPKSVGCYSSKYKFNGQEYGTGPLVSAIVEQYVKDNPDVPYAALKLIFPDTLLNRFSIFQNEATARTIAKGGNRYFTKQEQVIKLSDASIVVCNQLTAENIKPFLVVIGELGFEVN